MEAAAAVRRGRPPDPKRRARTRERILRAATACFAGEGYAETSVEEVASRAGVGKATVYRQFPSKKALFLAAADRCMVRLAASVDAAAASAAEPLDRVRRGARAYLAYCDAHPEVVDLLLQERTAFPERRSPTYFQHRDEKVRPWNELFRRLMDDGVVRRVPPERLTDVLGDALYGTMIVNHFSGRRRSLERQAGDLLDVLFRGILAAPPPPRPRRKEPR